MTISTIFTVIAVLALIGFSAARQRSVALVGGDTAKLHSLPRHYGYFGTACVLLPSTAVFVLWLVLGQTVVESLMLSGLPDKVVAAYDGEIHILVNRIRIAVEQGSRIENDPDILNAAAHYIRLYKTGLWATFGLSLATGLMGMAFAVNKARPSFRARNRFESILMVCLMVSSGIAIVTTLGIVASLLFESLRFFAEVPVGEFLFGLHWSPQTALRADQVGSSGAFGAVPLFAGTLLISFLALLVAGPIGLLSAIYLTQYANATVRSIVKPVLEILAGVPTVVYGFFAAITVAPWLRRTGEGFGIPIAAESALAAGLVMGIMIIPFVSSLSDDAITAVPKELQEGSLALGATRSETITKVILPAALPGIVGAFLLAISRAVGETMIVVMAAGMRPNLTANPFEAVTTVTVQIVALLTGDQAFDSAKTLSAFALGLILFIITLGLNVAALRLVRKYREIYE